MSGVGEIIGIIACVAAIVSAYKDGREVVSKIRERRQLRLAPLPARILDESLDEAARDIELEKSRGVTRLGMTFERGDDIAVQQLQLIQLGLEASFFRHLAQAVRDDNIVDFLPAVAASDKGRDDTLTTLIQLRQRLMTAAPLQQISLQPTSSRVLELPDPGEEGTAYFQPAQSTFATQFESPNQLQPTRLRAVSIQPELCRRKESDSSMSVSYFPDYSGLFRRKKSRDKEGEKGKTFGKQRLSTSSISHSSNLQGSSQASLSTISHRQEYNYPEDDTASIWRGFSNNTITPATVAAAAEITNADPSPFISTPRLVRQQNRPPLDLLIPAAENNYLGFCKGAWKYQCGAQDAMKKRLEFNSGWSSSEVPYLACSSSKCAFAYHLRLDQIDKVWPFPKKGISFRWTFLAKSHVPQSRVTKEGYSYQCMFCTLTGEGRAVWQSVDSLLDHLASHRGQGLAPEILHRTGCIDDRVAGEEEEFDINLHPLGKIILQPREDSIFDMEANPWS